MVMYFNFFCLTRSITSPSEIFKILAASRHDMYFFKCLSINCKLSIETNLTLQISIFLMRFDLTKRRLSICRWVLSNFEAAFSVMLRASHCSSFDRWSGENSFEGALHSQYVLRM
ncbi:hypothetical protein D3C81_1849310 [compost metagenome]